MKLGSVIFSVMTVLGVGALTSCNKSTSVEATVKESGSPARARNPMEIELTPELEQQVKVAEVPLAAVADSFTVAGRIEADRRRIANIHSPVQGRLTDMRVFAGDHVKKGQVLATLYGTGLTDIQLALIKALSQQQLAQRAVDRATQLVTAGVIGSAEVQRRQAEVIQATAEITVLRDQLGVLGMSSESLAKVEATRTVNSLTEITAEIDGTVLDRRASVGQIVQPSDTIYEIADLTSVWVVADVPEQQAGDIAVGKAVETEVSALSDVKIHSRLTYVSPTVNAETRTVQVRFDLPNPRRKYKPAMLAEMAIKEGAQRRRVIPLTGIVREENREYIFVQQKDAKGKTFALREVTLGQEFDKVRILLGGVEPTEKIIVDGAFHLNNERRRLALTAGN